MMHLSEDYSAGAAASKQNPGADIIPKESVQEITSLASDASSPNDKVINESTLEGPQGMYISSCNQHDSSDDMDLCTGF